MQDATESRKRPLHEMIWSPGDTTWWGDPPGGATKPPEDPLPGIRQTSFPDLLVPAPHLPPLRPNRWGQPFPPSAEEDDRCEVCWENTVAASNPLIRCKGCGVLVHQQCYGACRPSDDADWFCCVCVYWKQLGLPPCEDQPCPPPLLYCVICNRPKGAMKVGHEGKWVHVSCVLYNSDGPVFRNLAGRSAPINIQKSLVAHSRSRFGCSICRSNEGYTTGCSFPGCLKRVHVACVFGKGLKPKLQTITAEVPIYNQQMFWQIPGATSEPTETRVVEKLLKIVTCETHSSADAHNAVEEWERKMLKKTDLSSSLAPASTTMDQQSQYVHGGFVQPAAEPSRFPSIQVLPGAEAQTPATQTQAQQPNWAQFQQPAFPPQSFPGYSPYAGYAGMRPGLFYQPWGMNPYAGYPAGFRPPRSMYPYGADGRSAAGAYPPTPGAGYPYWSQPFSAPMMGRHSLPSQFTRPTGTHGVRVAVGVNKSMGTRKGEDAPGSPSSSKRGKLTTRLPPATGPSAALAKAARGILPKQMKVTTKGDEAYKLNKKKRSTMPASTSGRTAKIGGPLDPSAKAVTRSLGASTRRRTDDDDELGTASGHVLGSALSSRGLKVVWGRSDAHFKSLRGTAGQKDPLVSLLISVEQEAKSADTACTWQWIFGGSSVEYHSDADDKKLLSHLRDIWMKECTPVYEQPQEVKVKVPVSVVVSSRTPSEPTTRQTWTLWDVKSQEGGSTTPRKRASVSGVSGQDCAFTITPSPEDETSTEEVVGITGRDPGEAVQLKKAYRLTDAHATALKSGHVHLQDWLQRDQMVDETVPTDSIVTHTSSFEQTAAKAMTPNASLDDRLALFNALVEKAVQGVEDPTGTKIAPVGGERKKPSVDISSWNDVMRLENVLTRRFAVPKFFILVKKLPAELAMKSLSASTAAQATAVHRFMEAKEGVTLTLDPGALKKLATTSKKLHLQGCIWDLNPPFPASESIFRSLLPPNPSLPFSPQTLELPPHQFPIPIPDEYSKEILAACQRSRANRYETAPTPDEILKASQGEELVKVLASDAYWAALMMHDDFVRRQAIHAFLVWTRKRSRLRVLASKLVQVARKESIQPKRYCDSATQLDIVRKYTQQVTRWSSLRHAVQMGHQDPSEALVHRVEQERIAAETSVARVYFCLVCFGTELDNLNPLVTCNWCGIKVHKNCYAIGQVAQLDLDTMEWYCERCESERKVSASFIPSACRCAVCLRPGGALKKLTVPAHPRSYVHVTCALWLYPVIKCFNLTKLTDWRYIPGSNESSENVLESNYQSPCLLCARVLLMQKKMGGRKKAKLVTDEAGSDQISAVEAMSDGEVFDASKSLFETDLNTLELPFAQRGLTVKCCEQDCPASFHPLCAWLLGLRVEAFDDYMDSIIKGQVPGLPALNVRYYCETHSAAFPRMPIETISQHRLRSYVTKETEPFIHCHTNKAVDESRISSRRSTDAAKTIPVEEAKPVAGTRRPSIVTDPVPMSPECAATFTLPGACNSRLAGPDGYQQNTCQACLENNAEPVISCAKCGLVNVHDSECKDGILLNASQSEKDSMLLCLGCRLGLLPQCAVCPRLGGGFVSTPIACVAAALGLENISALADQPITETLNVHKFCLVQHCQDTQSIEWISKRPENEPPTEDTLKSIKPLVGGNCVDRPCDLCHVADGALSKCASGGCPQVAHPLCAALAGLWSLTSPDGEPPAKRRKLTKGSIDEGTKFVCAEHQALDPVETSVAAVAEKLDHLEKLGTTAVDMAAKNTQITLENELGVDLSETKQSGTLEESPSEAPVAQASTAATTPRQNPEIQSLSSQATVPVPRIKHEPPASSAESPLRKRKRRSRIVQVESDTDVEEPPPVEEPPVIPKKKTKPAPIRPDKKKKAPSLPLRNEKGQFIKRADAAKSRSR